MKKLIFLVSLGTFIHSSVLSMQESDKKLYEMRSELIGMSQAYLSSRALFVICELGVPDQIAKGLKTAEKIAAAVSADEQKLYRVMRMLSGHGIFMENENKEFSLTELGKLLQSDVRGSLRNYIRGTDQYWWDAVRDLEKTVRTGKSSFGLLHGKGYFEVLAQDQPAAQRFNAALQSYSAEESPVLARSYNFGRFGTIVDVGGGRGDLIRAIVERHKNVHGILYDLPAVTKEVQEAVRLRVVSGDFFKDELPHADAFMIKRVMLDFNDEQVVSVLSKAAKMIGSRGSVLVIDSMIPTGNNPDLVKDFDILMMTLLDGRHRTEKEFTMLFDKAGLKIVGTTQMPFGLWIIEGKQK